MLDFGFKVRIYHCEFRNPRARLQCPYCIYREGGREREREGGMDGGREGGREGEGERDRSQD